MTEREIEEKICKASATSSTILIPYLNKLLRWYVLYSSRNLFRLRVVNSLTHTAFSINNIQFERKSNLLFNSHVLRIIGCPIFKTFPRHVTSAKIGSESNLMK